MSIAALWLAATMATANAVKPATTVTQTPVAPMPTPQFRRYGITQGLPSSNVYTVTQDHRGYIWLGTRDGLARFDGSHFRVFHHNPRDPASFPANDVSNVMVDDRGRVWAGGEGTGLNLYRPHGGGFRHWRHHHGDPASLSADDVWALAQDSHGSIWVGTAGGGVDRLRADGHGFDHLRHRKGDAHSLSSNVILSLHAGAHGRLWIGTLAGLDLREADGRLRHVRFPALNRAPRVWHVDGHGDDLRVATGQGLFVVGPSLTAHRLAPKVLPHALVFQSLRRSDGTLWVATQFGLYWLRADGRHGHVQAHPLLPGALPGRLVTHLMVDREGGMWVTMEDGGLAYLPPDWKVFSHFAHVPDDPDSMAQSRILALAPGLDGSLFVGGPQGQLDCLDVRTGEVVHLGQRLDPRPRSVTALARAGGGDLWVGTQTDLRLFDGHRARRVALHGGGQLIVTDARGDAYVATPGDGVVRVDRHTLAVTAVTSASSASNGGETRAMRWHDGAVWRGSGVGISTLDVATQHFRFVPGISRGWVQSFAFGSDGLWVARRDVLEHYRHGPHGWQRVATVGAAQGWPSPLVHAMTVDARGRVWLFSENGMWRYDPAQRRFRDFGRNDGLPSAEFTSFKTVRAADGTVYTGTLGGVFGFRPDRQHDRVERPRMVLERLSVRRHGRLTTLPATGGALHLHWNDRDLRVSVRALSYIDPQRNRYRFRLVGFDPGWVDTGLIGEREFSGLGPGDYMLEVQASGPGHHWGALPVPLRISVARPPWLRPWAWAGYALLALSLGWLLIRLWRRRLEQRHRVRMAEQQRRLAEEASAAKTRFLAELGHEIRTPMTGVLGMAELLLRSPLNAVQHGYAEAIQHSGALLLKLVNEALDLARIEAHRFELELAPMDPAALLREVAQLEAGLAARKGLALTVEVREGVPPRVAGDAVRVKQVLLNLVNNALKFTERGAVQLGLERVSEELCFRVADTGPGIPAASRERLFQRFEQADGPQRRAGSGLGLAICRELVALMGGRIELRSRVAQGSVFEVWLPLPEVTEPAPAPAPADDDGSALSVLLVEDDPTVGAVIRGLLEDRGHRVEHALNGLVALSRLQADHFDAVLLDLDLPGVDGFRLAQMIRSQPDGEAIRLVAITARSGGDEQQRSLEAGMDGFLRKPLSGEVLAAALRGRGVRSTGRHAGQARA